MTSDAQSGLVPDPDHAGAYTVRVGGTDQSWVDPGDPTRLEFDYMQRIGDVLDTIAPAGERMRVVHVGGAGMSLARYVAATRPTSAQIVLEPDAELTEAVRATLPLPKRSGIKVRPVDGRAGIAAMPDEYAEVVIVDAFVGARVPAELTTMEFLGEVRRVLTGTGVLILNLTDRAPFAYTRRVLAGVGEWFGERLLSAEPATLKGRRFGNLLLAGSARALPTAALARRAAGSVFPYRLLHGSHLARFESGAAAYTDADAEQSPEPPGGPTVFR
ncbi:spermidine synthase [Enemella evansiae]|uniref:spermidine synthase n=1 Tax=Enemella evansiae TaxID=2016499 RepID=UPI000B970E69|nr:fused MFS/spermidine synthase [Enemella evansiae]OYO06082.1 spermidine synthase [Enemella evansiae]